MPFPYGKKDKLKSKTHIEQMFNKGKAITAYPLRLIYLETVFSDDSVIKTGVSVSKRLHKKAVTRNQIKRLLRETYRLNKPIYFNNSTTSYAFMILYLGKDIPNFDSLNNSMQTLLKKFLKKTNTHEIPSS